MKNKLTQEDDLYPEASGKITGIIHGPEWESNFLEAALTARKEILSSIKKFYDTTGVNIDAVDLSLKLCGTNTFLTKDITLSFIK